MGRDEPRDTSTEGDVWPDRRPRSPTGRRFEGVMGSAATPVFPDRALSALRVNAHRRFSRFREKFEESEPGRTSASGQLAEARLKFLLGMGRFSFGGRKYRGSDQFQFSFSA